MPTVLLLAALALAPALALAQALESARRPPGAAAKAGLVVAIDRARIPDGAAGWSTERLRAADQEPSGPHDVGAFRTSCAFSHMAFDDPIVYPGQPGKSHLHAFFGNTAVDAHASAESILHKGNSTCRGGTVNRSGYWVPAMIDTRSGVPVVPADAGFYYKTGYQGVAPQAVQPFPDGLRIVAGDPKNATPEGPFRYKCVGAAEDRVGPAVQNCPVGAELWQEIFFPQCWDGRNLDSPDHRSHMAYPGGRGCPRSHPVPLPEITFNIIYKIEEPDAPLHWRLSSDTYDGRKPAGYSAHGDWWNGWKREVMEAWVEGCDQRALDCHSHLLGDGRMIY